MSRWTTEAEALTDRLSEIAGKLPSAALARASEKEQALVKMLIAAGSPGAERDQIVGMLVAKLETGWKPKKGPFDGYYTKTALTSDDEMLSALEAAWARFVAEKGLPGAPPAG